MLVVPRQNSFMFIIFFLDLSILRKHSTFYLKYLINRFKTSNFIIIRLDPACLPYIQLYYDIGTIYTISVRNIYVDASYDFLVRITSMYIRDKKKGQYIQLSFLKILHGLILQVDSTSIHIKY